MQLPMVLLGKISHRENRKLLVLASYEGEFFLFDI